ncbi:hypothetical protein CAC42_2707 [Sphaceloma murrayae]|uniref:Uncharacterized protein n=1 Tax=Sphaceloma murrayae TaxID=2082308 RepID=A0A2K1R0H4_9PEZI|nr:hypothetical protein CAC42_2707 [Sphaceloma murrayae]
MPSQSWISLQVRLGPIYNAPVEVHITNFRGVASYIQQPGETIQGQFWKIDFGVQPLKPNSGVYAGHVTKYQHISQSFPPDSMIARPDDNLYLKTWSDGRIAIGAYSRTRGEFMVGVARVMPRVSRSGFPMYEPQSLGTFAFPKWYAAAGRGTADRLSFASGVFEKMGREIWWWSGIDWIV